MIRVLPPLTRAGARGGCSGPVAASLLVDSAVWQFLVGFLATLGLIVGSKQEANTVRRATLWLGAQQTSTTGPGNPVVHHHLWSRSSTVRAG